MLITQTWWRWGALGRGGVFCFWTVQRFVGKKCYTPGCVMLIAVKEKSYVLDDATLPR